MDGWRSLMNLMLLNPRIARSVGQLLITSCWFLLIASLGAGPANAQGGLGGGNPNVISPMMST
ncbi:MAG: hypothetical protein ACI8X5_003872 [Planctomycetota bacterium]|jgi:hypothetical protein